jgi:2-C-methyl-D-erythritol 4-phosphate cytidylyltransferase
MATRVIVAAGGLGTRLKTVRPKPLVMLNGKPLVVHCLETFDDCPFVDGVIVVTHEYHLLDFEDIIKHYRFRKVERVVVGGPTRCASVYNGLRETGEDTDIVIVHDGARPLIRTRPLLEAISQCKVHGAAAVAVAVKPTIKRVDPRTRFVRETLNRDELWEVQTPQVFKKDVLLKAYAQRGLGSEHPGEDPTDDAGLVERLGLPVKVVEGDYDNIKVTTNEDLIIAGAF